MQKFKNFYVHSAEFDIEKGEVYFHYSFDTLEYFTETIILSKDFELQENIDESVVENILFHVSLAFGISYYKLFPTENIVVDSGFLSNSQKHYWKNFYTQGLGEFFYTNNMNFSHLCNFVSSSEKNFKKQEFPLPEKTLLPIGGGKDSIVSSILLQDQKITPFIFGKIDSIKQDFLETFGQKELLIQRQIDPKLFVMNQEGYYNGHVPITGLISFFMTFVCYIYDYKYIVFSNEKSADTGNTDFHGEEINHQYSKSNSFRDDFSNYIDTYISSEISYESVLSEYYEIQIAKIFAGKGKKYFTVFSSCNKNFKISKGSDSGEKNSFMSSPRWCGNCPKCLFVYIILRPFLTDLETLQIFGEELYDRKDLEGLFLETLGFSGIKPFECVGEVDEAKLAAYMALEKFEKLPYLLGVFKTYLGASDTPEYFQKLQKKYNV